MTQKSLDNCEEMTDQEIFELVKNIESFLSKTTPDSSLSGGTKNCSPWLSLHLEKESKKGNQCSSVLGFLEGELRAFRCDLELAQEAGDGEAWPLLQKMDKLMNACGVSKELMWAEKQTPNIEVIQSVNAFFLKNKKKIEELAEFSAQANRALYKEEGFGRLLTANSLGGASAAIVHFCDALRNLNSSYNNAGDWNKYAEEDYAQYDFAPNLENFLARGDLMLEKIATALRREKSESNAAQVFAKSLESLAAEYRKTGVTGTEPPTLALAEKTSTGNHSAKLLVSGVGDKGKPPNFS